MVCNMRFYVSAISNQFGIYERTKDIQYLKQTAHMLLSRNRRNDIDDV